MININFKVLDYAIPFILLGFVALVTILNVHFIRLFVQGWLFLPWIMVFWALFILSFGVKAGYSLLLSWRVFFDKGSKTYNEIQKNLTQYKLKMAITYSYSSAILGTLYTMLMSAANDSPLNISIFNSVLWILYGFVFSEIYLRPLKAHMTECGFKNANK